jgi:hypothetical protein
LVTIIAFSTEAGVAPTIYNKGLIFMKDRDIMLTGDKWTFTVNIALDDYVNLIQGMRFKLAQIERNIEMYKSPTRKFLDIH